MKEFGQAWPLAKMRRKRDTSKSKFRVLYALQPGPKVLYQHFGYDVAETDVWTLRKYPKPIDLPVHQIQDSVSPCSRGAAPRIPTRNWFQTHHARSRSIFLGDRSDAHWCAPLHQFRRGRGLNPAKCLGFHEKESQHAHPVLPSATSECMAAHNADLNVIDIVDSPFAVNI